MSRNLDPRQATGSAAWPQPPRLQLVPISLDENDAEEDAFGLVQHSDVDEEEGAGSDVDDDATPVVTDHTTWNNAQRLPYSHYDASIAASSVMSEHEEVGNYSPIEAVNHSNMSISDPDLNGLADALQLVYDDVTLTAQQHFLRLKQRLLKEKEAVLQQRDSIFLEHSKRYQAQLEELQAKLEAVTSEHDALAERYEHMCVTVATSRTTLRRFSKKQMCYDTALLMWREHQQRRRQFSDNQQLGRRMHTRRQLSKAFAHLKNFTHRTVLKKQSHKSEEQLHAVSKDLISMYEARIHELTTQLAASEARCLAVQRSRAQLEEDLRRTFLKGMSVMNLEALSLFSSSKKALQTAHPSTGSTNSDDAEEVPRQAPPPNPST